MIRSLILLALTCVSTSLSRGKTVIAPTDSSFASACEWNDIKAGSLRLKVEVAFEKNQVVVIGPNARISDKDLRNKYEIKADDFIRFVNQRFASPDPTRLFIHSIRVTTMTGGVKITEEYVVFFVELDVSDVSGRRFKVEKAGRGAAYNPFKMWRKSPKVVVESENTAFFAAFLNALVQASQIAHGQRMEAR